MQASMLKTLPIGFLLFLVTYLLLRRKRSLRSRSLTDLPAFAAAESLHYQERTVGQVGVVTGIYRGFELRIDPENGAKIWLRFSHSPRVELRTFQYLKRQPQGLTQMLTSFRQFDSFFVERYVSQGCNRALLSLGDLNQLVGELKAAPQRLTTLGISPEGIEARLAIDRVPYIGRDTLEYLLPKLVRIAQVLDKPDTATPSDSN